ncbi:MAG: fatty acyl-AMP ligase [Rhodothalassiaceae bacterium]
MSTIAEDRALSGTGSPTPTSDTLPRRLGDFATLPEALDYAAQGERGLNFYSARGELSERMTYAELSMRARDIAARLMGLGLEPGDRVALIAATDPEFVAFFMGCLHASILPVPLPLPTSFGGREGYVSQLRLQMRSCGARALIGPDSMAEFGDEAASGLDLLFGGSFADFHRLALKTGPVQAPKASDLAYLQYSSGSTRFPHGIAITHGALMANCAGQGRDGVQLVDDDRCISWLPFYHDMGLVGTLLTPIANQVSVDFIATEDFARRPLQWLILMSQNRGTISYSPTFGYDICARRIGADLLSRLDLGAWRVAGIGGDMIRPDVLRRFAETFAPAGYRETAFVPSYGLAECTLAVSFAPLGRGMEIDLVDERILSGDVEGKVSSNGHHGPNGKKLGGSNGVRLKHFALNGVRQREVVNCGIPLPGYELEIRDDRGRKALGEREIGRVFVRGPSVMTCYFNDPEATRSVLSSDGWLDTGDMGYMSGGSLYVVGRAKDMIIINGRNHWPQDIEWAVEQLPGVRSGDIAAVSLPGTNDEEVPTVLVQCRLSDPEQRQHFAETVKRQILTVTGIQCRIELVPPRALPRTSSGKLSRTKARQQFLSGGIPALAY